MGEPVLPAPPKLSIDEESQGDLPSDVTPPTMSKEELIKLRKQQYIEARKQLIKARNRLRKAKNV